MSSKTIYTTALVLLLLALSTTVNAAIRNVPATYATIKLGIAAANVGDTVLIQPGTYLENNLIVDKAITVGSLFLTTGDVAYTNSTIIDAELVNGKQIFNIWSAGANGARISGLTAQRGRYTYGGGIAVNDCAPIIDHCVIRNNVSNGFGGGICTNHSNLTLKNVEFYGNTAVDGAGIAIQNSAGHTIIMDSCIVHDNTATWGGGVRLLNACTVLMNYVSIYRNTATYGGAINCYNNGPNLTINHGTIYANVNTNGWGGGLRMWHATQVNINNTIFHQNVGLDIVNQNAGSVINIKYSDVRGVSEGFADCVIYGAGVIHADPAFVEPDANDFHLQAGSLCIDTGDPDSPQDPDATTTDMGYYYFPQDPELVCELTSPVGGEALTAGDILNIIWTAEGGSGIKHTVVSYSLDGGANWLEIDTFDAPIFTYGWKIPYVLGDYLIKIVVYDNDDATVEDQPPAVFAVGPMTMTQWVAPGSSLLSVPLIQTNMHKNSVLGDNLAGQWALYGFNPAQGHTVPDTLRNGDGYFLITHQGATMDVIGLPNTNATHMITLKRSWNVIGNPFHLSTALASATVKLYDKEGTHTYTYDEAVDERVISPIAYNFFDARLPVNVEWPYLNNYIAYDTLKAWRGYWFMCYKDSVQLILPNPEAEDEPIRDDQVATVDDWHLDFVAASDLAGDNARIGANVSATAGFNNRFDYVEPPARDVDEWVRMYFDRSDWENPNATKFTRDIRSPLESGETQEWTLTIESAPETDLYLFWDEIMESTPEMNSYTLIDPDNDTELDLRQDYVYQFHSAGMKQLIVRVKSAFVSVNPAPEVTVSGFGLVSMYPNPFNARTSISFNLLVSADVKLSVFDLTGRKITDLFNSQAPAGNHTVNWNAQGFESGVYFVRFETPGLSQTKRIVLLK